MSRGAGFQLYYPNRNEESIKILGFADWVPFDTTGIVSSGDFPGEYKIAMKGNFEIRNVKSLELSHVESKSDWIKVNAQGFVLNPTDLVVSGDYSKNRVAMLLPVGYEAQGISAEPEKLSFVGVHGQRNSDKIVIDSLTTELKKANSILKYKKEEAERLQYLLTAKEMALRSTELKDSKFQALVAVQAHKFWTHNKGNYADIDIYLGLYNALKTFNDPLVKTLPIEIDKMDNADYAKTKLMADKLCLRVKRNMLLDEWNKFASHLPYEQTCPSTK